MHDGHALAQLRASAAGLLYDLAGDDQYLMDNGDPPSGGDPLYPATQRPDLGHAAHPDTERARGWVVVFVNGRGPPIAHDPAATVDHERR